jgi:hypothetical protein
MSKFDAPEQPLPRKYLQSILYLADRMAEADGNVVAKERRMIESLAEAAHMIDFRNDSSYRQLSDFRACTALDMEEAKSAALVVISLVMKTNTINRDEKLEYFRKVRAMLHCDPITVPTDMLAHKELALKYLG